MSSEEKILITGGAGFIGGRLAYFLKGKGYEVSLIDFPHQFIHEHLKDFVCYGYDISEKLWIDDLDEYYDYVIHVAAQSGGKPSLDDPQLDCKWNCMGTVNVVEFCKKIKPRKLIYTSSMAVYGNCDRASESTEPNPISYYGVSKLAGEYYVKLLKEHCNIPYTIYRLFASYGIGQDISNLEQGIVSIYIGLAQDSDEIGITGERGRVRHLVHVEDVLEALYLGISDVRTDNEIFNVVNDREICSPELIINAISDGMGRDLKIKELDGYVGDQTYITGTSEKLKQLGWESTFFLREGVKQFLEKLGYE